jgi:hypothetical protein
MKMRQGFVSNSSSSSFVILGYRFEPKSMKELVKTLSPEKYAKLEKESKGDEGLFEDDFWEYLYDGSMFKDVDTIIDDSVIYLGHEICDSDEGLPETSSPMYELVGKAAKVMELLKQDGSPVLYTGVRAC